MNNLLIVNTVIFGLLLLGAIFYVLSKSWSKIKRFFRKHKITRFLINVAFPFIIPLILSVYPLVEINKECTKGNRWSTFLIIVIIWAILNLVLQLYFWLRESKEYDWRWKNRAARIAYTNLYEVHMNKNTQIRSSYHNGLKKGMLTDADIPYDIFTQIRKITWQFCNTVSSICGIDTINMDASFIYHYTFPNASETDKEWRWVTGKGTKFSLELKDFINDTDSAFHYMINNNESAMFYNDKSIASKDRKYQFTYKDYSHDCVGSFVMAKVAFSGNDNQLCEGIIMVNTYGKRFMDDFKEYSEKEFSNLIIDDILPCFRNLLTTELAMLYFRHQDDQPKTKITKRAKSRPHGKTNIVRYSAYNTKKAYKCIIATSKKIWMNDNEK